MSDMLNRSLLSLLGIALGGCSLVTTEIETDVRVSGEVTGTSTQVYDRFVQDLLEIEDYKNNIDKVKHGEVYAFLIEFTSVHDNNRARTVGGRVNVRLASENDEGEWVLGVAQWNPVYLGDETDPDRNSRLNSIYLEPEPEAAKHLHEILFNDNPKPVEFELEGFASDAPVGFDYRVTVYIRIKASAG
jgi:hypothetical protein